MILNIIITIFLVLLNGFFVAAEFAIVKVRMSQIEMRIRSGSKLAKLSKGLITHLDAYLSATQLGITLASLGLGWIGESLVADIIIQLMHYFNIAIDPATAHSAALPIAFISITFLHIVFGELAPKSLAIQRAEQVTLLVSIPLRIFYVVFKPFIWILNSFANFLIRVTGLHSISESDSLHSPEELRYLIEESNKSGVLDDVEHTLIENVFEFADTPVKQIMVPRGKIAALDISMSANEILNSFMDEGYSRMPIYNDTIDNIIGVIYAKDLINLMYHSKLIIIHDIIRPINSVSEEELISKTLRDMQRNKTHVAVAIDEFGGTAGLVTLEDIIEEIVGEIQDEYDDEKVVVENLNEKEFVVQAATIISDVNDYLPIPLEESDDYESVGGLVINKIGRIPKQNEMIDIGHYICNIIKTNKRFIEEIKLILK
jgi:CBS domain containing-hemolysin-like protein